MFTLNVKCGALFDTFSATENCVSFLVFYYYLFWDFSSAYGGH